MSETVTSLQFYLSEVSQNRVLTREEEVSLFKRMADGIADAREELVKCNLKFVVQICQRFRSKGLPLEDLIQEGNVGLLEAIEKFDYKLGYRFSTYAAYWIRQAIQLAIRQRGSLIRIPIRKARQLGFMSEFIQESWAIKGRPPTERELAERLKITQPQARELARLGDTVLSLDAPIDEEGTPLLEFIPDNRNRPTQNESLEHERSAKIISIIQNLNERESAVISERFGLNNGKGRSLRKVSARLGMSQEGIRRVEQRALAKLRRPSIREAVVGLL